MNPPLTAEQKAEWLDSYKRNPAAKAAPAPAGLCVMLAEAALLAALAQRLAYLTGRLK